MRDDEWFFRFGGVLILFQYFRYHAGFTQFGSLAVMTVYINLIFSSRQNHIVSHLPLTSRIDIHNSLTGLLLLCRSKNLLQPPETDTAQRREKEHHTIQHRQQ